MYDKGIIDIVLSWTYATIKTPYLDIVELNIRATLSNMIQILEILQRQRNSSEITKGLYQTINSFKEFDASLLENLYQNLDVATNYYQTSVELQEKEKVNMLNCLQSLQYQISK